jgi:stage V sporulation protein R
MTPEETLKFEQSLGKITQKAREFGLDFYDMRFEICPADIIYTFGAYGMPTRYSHWSFGKSFHMMKTQYDYNLSRIYELVINSDPCYAFFLDGNSLIQNKMVAAHVYAHCDFFKNNQWFRHTSRKMTETMSRNAERLRMYEFKYGRAKVEEYLDAAMALQEHIDPRYNIGIPEQRDPKQHYSIETQYDDLWDMDEKNQENVEQDKELKKFPAQPEKDILGFIALNANDLEEWQRDIIFIVREEMLYFCPQIETKIMNEGWATYWHVRIMREIDMSEDEAIEFAKMHAGVLQPSRMGINPYYIGLKIWEDIEKRWDNPTAEEKEKYGRPGGQGKEKIFEVRQTENDISFIRNYLTKDLIEDLDLYLFQKVYTKWQVVETEWEQVREGLVTLLGNGGFPYMEIEDGNYRRNGELYIKHCHEGRDLDLYYLERTLPFVYKLWNKSVHLETVVEGKPQVYTFDGSKITKKAI